MADPIGDPARRDFLATAAAALAAACLPASTTAATMAPGPLDEASLADLAGRLGSGATTAQALATAYLERIEAIDRAGLMLRSVIEVNPYALELDMARASDDAPLVRRLRSAGVLLLGKANLSEWANFRSTHSISGWSGRGGGLVSRTGTIPIGHSRDTAGRWRAACTTARSP